MKRAEHLEFLLQEQRKKLLSWSDDVSTCNNGRLLKRFACSVDFQHSRKGYGKADGSEDDGRLSVLIFCDVSKTKEGRYALN